MKQLLKLAFAAALGIALLSACKPVLSPSQVAEEDYYAKISLTVEVVTKIDGDDVPIAKCPIKITRGDGNSYEFKCNSSGKFTHVFPVSKPASKDATLGDTFTITVDYESDNDLIGHQKGSETKAVAIVKGEKFAEASVTVTCTKQSE